MSYTQQILYSEKYYDDKFEYRHVILPKEISRHVERGVIMTENEWRSLGICMSRGWIHYGGHRPEPNIVLFRRKYKGKTPRQIMERKMRDWEKKRKRVVVNMDY